MNKFTAVIPVKKTSSRLPGKNLKAFGDENLLSRKIRQVKQSQIADRIVVSSNSEEMLEIAKKCGVDAIERPEKYADESVPLSEFFDYIVSIIDAGHLIWSCVTSPFFNEKLMSEAKREYLNALDNGFDSLITVYDFNHYLLDKNGPLNYSLGTQHKNSQQLEGIQLFTNGILFAPTKSVQDWSYNYGPKAYRFKVDQRTSIDIDTPLDYKAALAWI
jgi:CMP-N-acetylneuraminic acid synthetase